MGKVAQVNAFVPLRRQAARVIEPEIDMRRGPHLHTGRLRWLKNLIRMLRPADASVALPMRSVGRELEEYWPAREL